MRWMMGRLILQLLARRDSNSHDLLNGEASCR